MKWHSRHETPKEYSTLILGTFDEKGKLKEVQLGRAQFGEGEFQVWSSDMMACHHGLSLPQKFTHWAYEDEYWKLLEGTDKD